MRERITLVVTAICTLVVSMLVATQPAHAAVGLRVSGTRIVEANGNDFVMRGVSHPHVWYPHRTGAFADIKAKGANTVRVVLSGGRWPATTAGDLADVIDLCRRNRLVCVLENHDTTGYGEQGGAVTLDAAADFWIGLKSVLVGRENDVVINIGNEPVGNNPVTPDWTEATIAAIQKLRDNGFEHLLMVDAPNWGQDWRFVMRDNAQRVFDADPRKNVVFSIHMYGVFDTAAEITSYIDHFQNRGLPLVIGEFGHNHSDGDPDEDTIMSYARQKGVGYIGWSWSGNGGGVEYLDMVVDFDPDRLTSWGRRIFDGPDGIAATSRECTMCGVGGPQSPSPPSSPSPSPSPSPSVPASPSPSPSPSPSSGTGTGGCTAAYAILGQWPGGFQGEVRVTAGGSAINGWTVRWTFPDGQTITSAWNAQISGGGSVTATNMSYNGRLGPGQSTTFGFLGSWSGTNNAPATVTCTAS